MRANIYTILVLLFPTMLCGQSVNVTSFLGNLQYTTQDSLTVASVLNGGIVNVDRVDGITVYSGINPFPARASSTTAVVNAQPVKGLSVFPNPVHDQVNLQIDTERNGEMTIKLFDTSGKQVLGERWDTTNPQKRIDFGHLWPGTWHMVITEPGKNRQSTFTLLKRE